MKAVKSMVSIADDRQALALFFLGLLVICSLVASAQSVSGIDPSPVMEAYGKLPLRFEANRGQSDSQVQFLARGSGYTLFLTPKEAVLSLGGNDERERPDSSCSTSTVLRMKWVDANPQPQVIGQKELSSGVNYFLGSDATRWHTDIPTYAKVRYQNVYPGIDMVYYGCQGELEFDFIITGVGFILRNNMPTPG